MSSQRDRKRTAIVLSRLASCIHCRCLILVFHWPAGGISYWDPGFLGRRYMLSIIGAGEWLRLIDQPWGLCYSMPHFCPPEDLRRARTARQNRPEMMP